MNNSIPFSVLISVYYKEKPDYLKEALDSVLNQSCLPTEIVLVKDGPLTPELNDVIAEFDEQYPLFKIIENKRNLGLGLSLAKGLLACSNEFIARMDTDDIIPNDRFELQLEKIKEGYDIVSSWSEIFEGSADNIIAIRKIPEFDNDIKKLAKKRSPVCHAACMIRKSAVIAAGNYQDFLLVEDYYLWVCMIMNGANFYNIQKVLYKIRGSNDQFGRRGGLKYLKIELKLHYKFYKLGFLNSYELLRNIFIRIIVRLLPVNLRRKTYLLIWGESD